MYGWQCGELIFGSWEWMVEERFNWNFFVDVFYLQIVGRGNDQVAMTTKFETRDDMCRFSKLNHMLSRSPLKLRAKGESDGI